MYHFNTRLLENAHFLTPCSTNNKLDLFIWLSFVLIDKKSSKLNGMNSDTIFNKY
jgi:hypothetical protein